MDVYVSKEVRSENTKFKNSRIFRMRRMGRFQESLYHIIYYIYVECVTC